MTSEHNATPASTCTTLTAAALLLTFLQLLTAWFENIYRMSLIKLEMGPELAGLLLPLLAPLLAWAMRRAPRLGMRVAVLAYLAIYALVWYPPTTPVQTILLAGTGVATALALAAHALSGPHGPRINGFAATAIATMAYVLLRTANNSLDLYMAGSLWGLLPLFFLLPLLKLEGVWYKFTTSSPERGGALLPSLALFANITLVFVVISCPESVSAWHGVEPTFDVLCLAVGMPIAGLAAWRLLPVVRTVSSLLFFVVFTAMLLAGRVDLPTAPGEIVEVTGFGSNPQFLLTLLFWLLSPTILLNIAWLLPMVVGRRPVALVGGFVAGLYFLVFISLLLVFTNVWGYVDPVGSYLRNQFVAPFILCGIGVMLPLFLLRKQAHNHAVSRPSESLDTLVFVAFILVFFEWSDATIPAPSPNTFTVLTYNYQQGSREDGDQAYVAQCEFIRRVNPDIVVLQESDTARPSGGFVNSPEYFADSLGYYLYYGPSSISGTFGTAILSRFPMRNPRTIFTYSDVDEVGTAVVDLKIGDKLVTLYNNHPAGSDTVMNAHADMLVKEVQRGGPVIAAGDFNSRPDEAPYKAIAATLNDAWASLYPTGIGPGYNLDTKAPEGELDMSRRIDHIFVSSDFQVVSSHYIEPPDSITDHPAHWTVLRW